MPKEEWGVKRACPKCSVRFYDLQNDPMTCPSCDAEFTLESLIDAAKSRGVVKAKVVSPKAPAPATTDDDLEVVLDDDDEEADASVGDDLLDDDDDADTTNLEEIADAAKDEDNG